MSTLIVASTLQRAKDISSFCNPPIEDLECWGINTPRFGKVFDRIEMYGPIEVDTKWMVLELLPALKPKGKLVIF